MLYRLLTLRFNFAFLLEFSRDFTNYICSESREKREVLFALNLFLILCCICCWLTVRTRAFDDLKRGYLLQCRNKKKILLWVNMSLIQYNIPVYIATLDLKRQPQLPRMTLVQPDWDCILSIIRLSVIIQSNLYRVLFSLTVMISGA